VREGGGADLWIERYDGAWLAMGWCAVLGVMAVVPFALVFGVSSVLWLWWVIALVICLCVWAMHESNSVGISAHNHMVLLMVVVLALRTAILGTSVVEPMLPTVLSLLQLAALVFILAVRAHPFPVVAAVFVLIQLCRDMLVLVARDHRSVAHAQVALATSLGCLGLTYALHWDGMRRWLKAHFHIDGDRHLCGTMHHRMALQCCCARRRALARGCSPYQCTLSLFATQFWSCRVRLHLPGGIHPHSLRHTPRARQNGRSGHILKCVPRQVAAMGPTSRLRGSGPGGCTELEPDVGYCWYTDHLSLSQNSSLDPR